MPGSTPLPALSRVIGTWAGALRDFCGRGTSLPHFSVWRSRQPPAYSQPGCARCEGAAELPTRNVGRPAVRPAPDGLPEAEYPRVPPRANPFPQLVSDAREHRAVGELRNCYSLSMDVRLNNNRRTVLIYCSIP